jgi:hypothetical protein
VLLGPNILLSTLFSNTLSPCSFHTHTNQQLKLSLCIFSYLSF